MSVRTTTISNVFASIHNLLMDYEQFIFTNYQKSYSKNNSTDHKAIESLLIEMAQKGKQTRLLDVTSDSIIALYNAVANDADQDKDGIIFVFKEDDDFYNEMSIKENLQGSFYPALIHAK